MLVRLHQEKGYYFVHVEARRAKTKQANVQDVTFVVIPNNKVKVAEVVMEGAHSLPVRKLLGGLKSPGYASRDKAYDPSRTTAGRVISAPVRWVRKLFDSSYYRRETVLEDRRRIEQTYRDEGFQDVKVVFVGVQFDEKRKRARIHYRIEEGPRYVVRKVKVEYVEGGLPDKSDQVYLAADKLTELATIGEGSPARRADIEQTRRGIAERLHGRAYAKAEIVTVVRPLPDANAVDVTYSLKAGAKVRLGQIKFIGNRFTRDNVLRREFRDGAEPGDYLDIEALQSGVRRLMTTRYFNFVRFGRQPHGLVPSSTGEPDMYDVEIVLEEASRTRSFNIGGAVDTDGGATLTLEVSWQNFDIGKPPKKPWQVFSEGAFRGGGQRFSVLLAPGTRNSQFAVAFSDPRLNDSRWSLSTQIFRRLTDDNPDYDVTTDAFVARIGRWLDTQFRWRLSLEWTIKQVLLDQVVPNSPVNALDQQGFSSLNGILVALRRVRRRETVGFLDGHVSNASAQLYGLGLDVEIVKLHFDHSAGWRLFKNKKGWNRVIVRFGVDWATAYGDTPEVPIYERYFLGGNNLRGFDFREVGPRSNGRPTGGEFRVTLTTEYVYPLVGAEDGVGVDFVMFLDQGGLSTTFDTWDSDTWRVSAGFGFAVSFSLGGSLQPPLLIHFGWPIVSQVGDERRLISVTFVRNF
jgi:outer membrane protein insertion porin family